MFQDKHSTKFSHIVASWLGVGIAPKCLTSQLTNGWIENKSGPAIIIIFFLVCVLIGKTTSTRKWIKYEIEKAYELNKGIVGIYIHKLKDEGGKQTDKGANPFYSVYTNDGERLSKYVICFDSNYQTSKYVYDDISDNIEDLIEDALSNKAPQ